MNFSSDSARMRGCVMHEIPQSFPMRRLAPFLKLPLLLCGMALLFSSGAFADLVKGGAKKPDKNEVLIPEARDATVRFGAGQTVLIELTAAVGSLSLMEFVIRDRPQQGSDVGSVGPLRRRARGTPPRPRLAVPRRSARPRCRGHGHGPRRAGPRGRWRGRFVGDSSRSVRPARLSAVGT